MTVPTRVLKFGGTSVTHGLPTALRVITEARRRGPVVVVVSAFAGLTDALTRIADGELSSRDVEVLVTELAQRCGDIRSPHLLDLGRLARLATGDGALRGATRHALLAVGERLAAEAVVRSLRRRGLAAEAVDGTEVLAADASGRVDLEGSARLARGRLTEVTERAVPVVTGFIARADGKVGTPLTSGRTVTLGRGASDLSATVVAAALRADEVEIWTDTDGIWTADPNRLPCARPIRHLSHGQASAMAHWGAKVLHPETIEPVAARGIPVAVRSVFEPDAPGSRVDAEGPPHPVVAVSRLPSPSDDGLVWIAAIGADPADLEAVALPVADGDIACRMVERAEAGRPRVAAWLVPAAAADAVEGMLHRVLVEHGEGVTLRRTA